MEELITILEGVKPGVDFRNNQDLIGSGAIKSLDMLMIIGQLMQEYELDIPTEEILPENFKSAESIYALIERLQKEE